MTHQGSYLEENIDFDYVLIESTNKNGRKYEVLLSELMIDDIMRDDYLEKPWMNIKP